MRFSGILFLLISIIGCNSGAKLESPDANSLEGNWVMQAAARDGKLTETLKDSYFKFQKPDVLINNINRREMSFKYKVVENNTIEQRGALDLDYQILKFQNDTLVLRTEIRDYDFQFLLLRDTAKAEIELISS